MKYYSTNRQSPQATFQEAAIKGLAPDGGLYFPEEIPLLPETLIQNIKSLSPETFPTLGFFNPVKPVVLSDLSSAKFIVVGSNLENTA